MPSLHVIIVSTGHVVETGTLVLIVLVGHGLNVGSVIRDSNCWIYHLWNKAVLLQLSLAREALLCMLPQLDVTHILADNISKEIKHGNILAQTLLGISVRFFEKTYQCHLQQHGRFMFIAVNLVKLDFSWSVCVVYGPLGALTWDLKSWKNTISKQQNCLAWWRNCTLQLLSKEKELLVIQW